MATNGKFPYPGAVDADGHILEPPDLWEKYIDPKYKDRAIRLRTNEDGLEVLELNGLPSKYSQPGQLAQFGAMGKKSQAETAPHPDRTYVGEAPFGSMYPKERLARMDQEFYSTRLLSGWLSIRNPPRRYAASLAKGDFQVLVAWNEVESGESD